MGTALQDLPQDKRIVLHCKTGVRIRGGPRRAEVRGLLRRRARRRRRHRLGQPDRAAQAGLLSGPSAARTPDRRTRTGPPARAAGGPVRVPAGGRAGEPRPAVRSRRCPRPAPCRRRGYAFTALSRRRSAVVRAVALAPARSGRRRRPARGPRPSAGAPPYGVAGSPVLPTTRMRADPVGADVRRVRAARAPASRCTAAGSRPVTRRRRARPCGTPAASPTSSGV